MPDTAQKAGSSLSDLLTGLKNLVQSVNTLAQNYLNVQGLATADTLTIPTVVKPAPGRVCRVSVTIAGSAPGMIYDGANLQSTTKPIYVIPNTVGVTEVNLPTGYGVLVVPGTGQTVSVSWS